MIYKTLNEIIIYNNFNWRLFLFKKGICKEDVNMMSVFIKLITDTS